MGTISTYLAFWLAQAPHGTHGGWDGMGWAGGKTEKEEEVREGYFSLYSFPANREWASVRERVSGWARERGSKQRNHTVSKQHCRLSREKNRTKSWSLAAGEILLDWPCAVHAHTHTHTLPGNKRDRIQWHGHSPVHPTWDHLSQRYPPLLINADQFLEECAASWAV